MPNKVVSMEEAVALIRDGDTLCISGSGAVSAPNGLLAALAQRFLKTGDPHNLTLVFASGPGDGKDRGLNLIAHQGLLRRVIGGHFGHIPKLAKLALENKIEGYSFPQGAISQLYRDIAAARPGVLSKAGLHTFVDPRLEGGKINPTTAEDLVRLIEVDGKEWLLYRSFPIQVAFLRGTTADLSGNVTMEHEALRIDSLAMAMAVKNSNGIVIVQVERIAANGSLGPRQVEIPGIFVDHVVVASPEHHLQTYGTLYSPALSAEIRVPQDALFTLPLDVRKLIARRAALELSPHSICALGSGLPESVAAVAREERVLDYLTLMTDSGVLGGVPASGLDFGTAVNPEAIINQNQLFDFYDGGGLDLAYLPMAECDAAGNVNVSRCGSRLWGAGSFINISQNVRKLVFVGSFTQDGLEVTATAGRLSILREGHKRSFVQKVEQVTFSGSYAAKLGQKVYYVTERCVFELGPEGLELIEVAPGIDLRDDILAEMDFAPIVRSHRPMDARIFRPELIDLKGELFHLNLSSRLSYDRQRNILFGNFAGLYIRNLRDIETIRHSIERTCRAIGHKVAVVVNYDSFQIEEAVTDAYAEVVSYLTDRYYIAVSRHTSNAFMRMKLGDALLRRGVEPHIFDSAEAASSFHG